MYNNTYSYCDQRCTISQVVVGTGFVERIKKPLETELCSVSGTFWYQVCTAPQIVTGNIDIKYHMYFLEREINSESNNFWVQRCTVFSRFGRNVVHFFTYLVVPELYSVKSICWDPRCTVSHVVAGSRDLKR